jgi:hypothetical protein
MTIHFNTRLAAGMLAGVSILAAGADEAAAATATISIRFGRSSLRARIGDPVCATGTFATGRILGTGLGILSGVTLSLLRLPVFGGGERGFPSGTATFSLLGEGSFSQQAAEFAFTLVKRRAN